MALREWGDRWDASRFGVPMEMVDRETGHPLRLSLVDIETGEVVSIECAALRPGPDADDAVRRLLDPRSAKVG